MTEYVLPWLAVPVALNGAIDTAAARRFARTTRTAAQGLRRGVEEALRSGNESDFNNAYLVYAGQLPSNVNPNDGGERADVLRRMITAASAQANPATVSQQELIRLGQRLNSSDSIARADYAISTPLFLTTAPAALTVVISGHSSVRIAATNGTNAVINLNFTSFRGVNLFITSATGFVHSRVGGVAQNPVMSLVIRSQDSGSYNIAIPAATTLTFEISSSTAITIDSASNFTKAAAGYNRARSDGLLVGAQLYPSLDMWMAASRQATVNAGSIMALVIMLLESYEDTCVALSVHMQS